MLCSVCCDQFPGAMLWWHWSLWEGLCCPRETCLWSGLRLEMWVLIPWTQGLRWVLITWIKGLRWVKMPWTKGLRWVLITWIKGLRWVLIPWTQGLRWVMMLWTKGLRRFLILWIKGLRCTGTLFPSGLLLRQAYLYSEPTTEWRPERTRLSITFVFRTFQGKLPQALTHQVCSGFLPQVQQVWFHELGSRWMLSLIS